MPIPHPNRAPVVMASVIQLGYVYPALVVPLMPISPSILAPALMGLAILLACAPLGDERQFFALNTFSPQAYISA
jgi:hypothetical protein